MPRRHSIATALSFAFAILLSLPSGQAAAEPAKEAAKEDLRISTGMVAAQFIGRLVVGLDSKATVIGFFPSITRIGPSLFAGNPSEATAMFTARSTPGRFGPTFRNGSLEHLVLLPDEGNALLFNIHYDPKPKRDYNSLDSFSTGKVIATFALPRALATRSSGSLAYTATLEMIKSDTFEYEGRTIDPKRLLDAITIHLAGTSPALNVRLRALSFSFGAAVLAVSR